MPSSYPRSIDTRRDSQEGSSSLDSRSFQSRIKSRLPSSWFTKGSRSTSSSGSKHHIDSEYSGRPGRSRCDPPKQKRKRLLFLPAFSGLGRVRNHPCRRKSQDSQRAGRGRTEHRSQGSDSRTGGPDDKWFHHRGSTQGQISVETAPGSDHASSANPWERRVGSQANDSSLANTRGPSSDSGPSFTDYETSPNPQPRRDLQNTIQRIREQLKARKISAEAQQDAIGDLSLTNHANTASRQRSGPGHRSRMPDVPPLVAATSRAVWLSGTQEAGRAFSGGPQPIQGTGTRAISPCERWSGLDRSLSNASGVSSIQQSPVSPIDSVMEKKSPGTARSHSMSSERHIPGSFPNSPILLQEASREPQSPVQGRSHRRRSGSVSSKDCDDVQGQPNLNHASPRNPVMANEASANRPGVQQIVNFSHPLVPKQDGDVKSASSDGRNSFTSQTQSSGDSPDTSLDLARTMHSPEHDSDEVNSIATGPGQTLQTSSLGLEIDMILDEEASKLGAEERSALISDVKKYLRSKLMSGNDIVATSGKASVSSLKQNAVSSNGVPTRTWSASRGGYAEKNKPPSSNSAQASHTRIINRPRPVERRYPEYKAMESLKATRADWRRPHSQSHTGD